MADDKRSRGTPGKGRRERRPFLEDASLLRLIQRLESLEKISHPSEGKASETAKDRNAFDALNNAGVLLREMAGWAIHHRAGLAINKIQTLKPRVPQQTAQLPEYQSAKVAADSHDNETTGQITQRADIDPTTARQIAINVLSPLATYLGIDSLIEGLKALDTGEVLPIVQPAATFDKVRYTETRFQLAAITLVEYWTARQMQKQEAQALVSDAFGVSVPTLRSWEGRVRQALGEIEVSETISRARNLAANFKAEVQAKLSGEDNAASPQDFDWEKGPDSATEIGAQYKLLKKQFKKTK